MCLSCCCCRGRDELLLLLLCLSHLTSDVLLLAAVKIGKGVIRTIEFLLSNVERYKLWQSDLLLGLLSFDHGQIDEQ